MNKRQGTRYDKGLVESFIENVLIKMLPFSLVCWFCFVGSGLLVLGGLTRSSFGHFMNGWVANELLGLPPDVIRDKKCDTANTILKLSLV